MTDITELMADGPIRRMARDLHRNGITEREVTDGLGRPLLAFTLETGNEYREERGGTLEATHGAIATAVLAVAFAAHPTVETERG